MFKYLFLNLFTSAKFFLEFSSEIVLSLITIEIFIDLFNNNSSNSEKILNRTASKPAGLSKVGIAIVIFCKINAV